MSKGIRVRRKLYGRASSGSGGGGGGSAGGGTQSIQWNDAGVLQGFGRYDQDNYDKVVLDEGAFRSEIDLSNFGEVGPVVLGFGLASAHPIDAVNEGENSTTYFVQCHIAVQDDTGVGGGGIAIAGVFKKDGAGILTQIGATQTIMAAQENISGSLVASFNLAANTLSCDVTTAGADCYSAVFPTVVCVTNI